MQYFCFWCGLVHIIKWSISLSWFKYTRLSMKVKLKVRIAIVTVINEHHYSEMKDLDAVWNTESCGVF